MSVLALRLAGPMQSWGATSRFSQRDTQQAPTKSGVLGLLAAARGLRRTDPIEDLLHLRFGVRKDQPGELMRDFHTAHKRDGSSMPLSYRYYLSDAVFLAGLEGDRGLLDMLDEALRFPVFPLYLGRRSCPPVGQVTLGVRDQTLEELLAGEPWQASPVWQRRGGDGARHLEVLCDRLPAGRDDHGLQLRDAFTLQDVPVSWDPELRQYGWRTVQRGWLRLDPPADGEARTDGPPSADEPSTHEPMAAVGW